MFISQPLHRASSLQDEVGNLKGELTTINAHMHVMSVRSEVLETAPTDFLLRTSDRMQTNANVSRVGFSLTDTD